MIKLSLAGLAVADALNVGHSKMESCRAAAVELASAGNQIEADKLKKLMQTISNTCLPHEQRKVTKTTKQVSSFLAMHATVSHGVKVVAMSKECMESAKEFANSTMDDAEENVEADSMKLGYGLTATVRTNMNLLQEMYTNLMYHCASADGYGESFTPYGQHKPNPDDDAPGGGNGRGRGKGGRGGSGGSNESPSGRGGSGNEDEDDGTEHDGRWSEAKLKECINKCNKEYGRGEKGGEEGKNCRRQCKYDAEAHDVERAKDEGDDGVPGVGGGHESPHGESGSPKDGESLKDCNKACADNCNDKKNKNKCKKNCRAKCRKDAVEETNEGSGNDHDHDDASPNVGADTMTADDNAAAGAPADTYGSGDSGNAGGGSGGKGRRGGMGGGDGYEYESEYESEQSEYESEQSEYESEKSSYESEQSSYASEGSEYESEQSSYTSEGSSYASEGSESSYASEGSEYESEQSSYTSEGSSYASEGSESSYASEGSEYESEQSSYTSEGSSYASEGSESSYASEGSEYESEQSSYTSEGSSYASEGSESSYASEGSESEYESEGSEYESEKSSYTSESEQSSYTSEGSSYESESEYEGYDQGGNARNRKKLRNLSQKAAVATGSKDKGKNRFSANAHKTVAEGATTLKKSSRVQKLTKLIDHLETDVGSLQTALRTLRSAADEEMDDAAAKRVSLKSAVAKSLENKECMDLAIKLRKTAAIVENGSENIKVQHSMEKVFDEFSKKCLKDTAAMEFFSA